MIRDPLEEARERIGGRGRPRVLEPSREDLDADPLDPTPRRGEDADLPAIVPGFGCGTWSGLATDDPELAAWCAPRWLAAWAPLPALTACEHTIAALDTLATGLMGPWLGTSAPRLRWARGGIATPVLPGRRQLRVDGGELVVVHGAITMRSSITTLRGAALVAEVTAAAPVHELDVPLRLEAGAVTAVASWLGFATALGAVLRRPVGSRRRGTSAAQQARERPGGPPALVRPAPLRAAIALPAEATVTVHLGPRHERAAVEVSARGRRLLTVPAADLTGRATALADVAARIDRTLGGLHGRAGTPRR